MPTKTAETAVSHVDLTVDAGRCRRARCTACVDACASAAIQVHPRPAVTRACTGCGVCTAVCPTGALRTLRRTDAAIASEATEAGRSSVVFACERHASAPPGAVRLPCLGRLTPGLLLAVIEAGASTVELHRPTCEGCALRRSSAALPRTLRTTGTLLSMTGSGTSPIREVLDTRAPLAGSPAAPVAPEANVARRDFLRRLFPWGSAPAVADSRHAMRDDRTLLLDVLGRLPATVVARSARSASTAPVPGTGSLRGALGWLAGGTGCTACGVCVSVCPAGALALAREPARATLSLRPRSCTGCEACVAVCEPGALALVPPPSLAAALASDPVRVLEVTGRPCETCGALVAGPSGSEPPRPGDLSCATCARVARRGFSLAPSRTCGAG